MSSFFAASSMPAYCLPMAEPGLFYDPVLRMGISWIDTADEDETEGRDELAMADPEELARAVAGIVAVAAERARRAGNLNELREAVARALEVPGERIAEDPREAMMPALPAISDRQPRREAERLAALMQRQASRHA